jgi:hypothetical protein
MARYHGITENTYSRMIIDSGQLRIGYVDEDNPGALIGVTRGGSVFEIAPDIRDMPVDGVKGEAKGSKRIARVTATLTANILEFKSWVIKLATPGSINVDYPEVTPTHVEIKRFLLLSLAKYQSSIAIIGEVKDTEEPVVCILKNVIGTNGINITFVENDESVMQIVFTAHFNPETMDSEPWRILSIKGTSPERIPAAWWKGEDDFVDSIQPGLPLVPWNTELSPRFTDGIVNRCFIVDDTGALDNWDSLTIGVEPAIQSKTNISSFETWELELCIKMTTQANWCYLFQAYDFEGSDDFIAATIDRVYDHYYIDIYNQEGGPDYPLFDNLPLIIGQWYKIRLKYTKASHAWELYIDDILQTSTSGINTQSVNERNYTTFFAGVPWNAPVLHVDEIKIFTGTPVPAGPTLISHWPGEDSPVDIVSGHDMLGADDQMHPTPVPIAPYYVVGVVGKAFDFHYGKVRGQTPLTTDLCIQHDSEFIIEGYFKVHSSDEGDPTIAHWCTSYTEENIPSFLFYPWLGGFSVLVCNDSGDKNLFFAYSDHDAWTPDVPFHIRFMYNNGIWKCYADTIEVPLQLGEGKYDNPAPIRDDTPTAQWFFGQFSDEIKFSKSI